MLKKVVDIILNSKHKIVSGTLYCNEISIVDKSLVECIEFLESNNILENTDYESKVGEVINLELSLIRLNSIGFYESCDKFILKNKYSWPPEPYYIYELRSFNSDLNDFVFKYQRVINLINAIKNVAKHTYTDVDVENSIIFREDKSVILPFLYDSNSILSIDSEGIKKVEYLTTLYNENNSEKKLLFLNELLDFLQLQQEDSRFAMFLSNISNLFEKSNNAYQFYLRDFSYNKLKIELDSKALEFTQKIQAVINESQTKLIAIPTAFVLVFVSLDFTTPVSIKNIGTILSLFIFSVLIQLFLNNQKSTLKFIKENINSYLKTFKSNEIEKNSSKFSLVEAEFKKQIIRLRIVEVILWVIPTILLFGWIYLIYSKPILSGISFLIIFIKVFITAFH